jgi:hypothetical protein
MTLPKLKEGRKLSAGLLSNSGYAGIDIEGVEVERIIDERGAEACSKAGAGL